MPRTRGQRQTEEGYVRITIGLITTGVGIGVMFVPLPLVQAIGAGLAGAGLQIIGRGTQVVAGGAMLRLRGGSSDAVVCSTVDEAVNAAKKMKVKTLPRNK